MLDGEIKALLSAIKEDIAELKPQVTCTHDCVVELKTQTVIIHQRLEDLELKTFNILQSIPSLQTKLDANNVEVLEIKRSRSKIIYWALGLVVVLLGCLAGWVSAVSSLQSEVTHLASEQDKIRSVLATKIKNSTMRGP
jgi:hypothetical protein